MTFHTVRSLQRTVNLMSTAKLNTGGAHCRASEDLLTETAKQPSRRKHDLDVYVPPTPHRLVAIFALTHAKASGTLFHKSESIFFISPRMLDKYAHGQDVWHLQTLSTSKFCSTVCDPNERAAHSSRSSAMSKFHFISAGGGSNSLLEAWDCGNQPFITPASAPAPRWWRRGMIPTLATSLASRLSHSFSDPVGFRPTARLSAVVCYSCQIAMGGCGGLNYRANEDDRVAGSDLRWRRYKEY